MAAERLSLEERILLAFARNPGEPEIGATPNYTLENCLDFAIKTVPDLPALIQGRRVLDFGCGNGWQAVALKRLGAAEVWGLDIVPASLTLARQLAEKYNTPVCFTDRIPEERMRSFDVVLSLCAFEHFSEPAAMLQKMHDCLTGGGRVIISFGEPWYSHSGSHFGVYTRIPCTNRPIPWCNLFFSDKAMLTLRSRFRPERPSRIEDITGGLNRMTIARFEQIIRGSGMQIERLNYGATKGLPLVTRVPVVRELLTSSLTCVLRP